MSGDNIAKFQPVEVGEGYRFDPDEMLDAAKGQGFETMCIIGEMADGSIWISGTANAGESMILLERAKHALVFGEDD